MEYALGKKFEKHLTWYLQQLEYDLQPGRESALEMIKTLINTLPPVSALNILCFCVYSVPLKYEHIHIYGSGKATTLWEYGQNDASITYPDNVIMLSLSSYKVVNIKAKILKTTSTAVIITKKKFMHHK